MYWRVKFFLPPPQLNSLPMVGNERGGMGNERGGMGNERGGMGNEQGGMGNEQGEMGNEEDNEKPSNTLNTSEDG